MFPTTRTPFFATLKGALPTLCFSAMVAALTSARGETRVTDTANLLPPAIEIQLEEIGHRLMENHDIPIAIITIESLAAQNAPGMSLTDFTANLFVPSVGGSESFNGQDWTSGILLVRSTGDNALEMRAGIGWKPADRERLEQVSKDALTPWFSRNQHAEGILAAARAWEDLARVVDPPTLSYWERFVALEKYTLSRLLEKVKTPTWKNLYTLFPFIVIPFFLWELIRPWRRTQPHLRPQLGLDIFYTIFNQSIFLAVIGSAVCGITAYIFHDILARFFGVQNIVAIHLNELPLWIRYLLLLLAIDFLNYWVHRLLHKVDFLWEFHKVHHSAQNLDIFNAIRLHFVENLLYRFVSYVPLGLIGFAVTDTFFVSLFISVFSFFTHANVRLPLGPLKYILNNPQLHIWHHTVDVHDRGNVNFGDALSLWDFIFGTGYAPPDRDNLKLGFGGDDTYPTTFFGQLAAPFKSIYRRLFSRKSS